MMLLRFLSILVLFQLLADCSPRQLVVSSVVENSGNHKSVLIVRKAHQRFAQVTDIMVGELKADYTIKEAIVSDDHQLPAFESALELANPDALILMDNISVSLAKSYVDKHQKLPPSVALMSLNLHRILQDSTFISGIAYEVPAFLTISKFMQLTNTRVDTVLVVFRKPQFESLANDTMRQLAAANIKVVTLDATPVFHDINQLRRFLRNGIQKEVSKNSIDAVWVITDSGLLNWKTFDIWKRKAADLDIPFLCYSDELVKEKHDFCAFATTPNLEDMAQQAVLHINDFLEGHISPEDIGVEYVVTDRPMAHDALLQRLGIRIPGANQETR